MYATWDDAPSAVDEPVRAGLIGRASRDYWAARGHELDARRRRQRALERLHGIDAVLEELEQRHLQGNREYDRSVRARIRGLEELVALPLPRKVTRARNTVRLHAALLDWQEIVLDDLFPERAELPDLEDEDILELVSEQPRLRLLDAS
ncbi:MAG: hypothetical protein NVSMB29_05650 [Candidatus Dormibacteria bacterium]